MMSEVRITSLYRFKKAWVDRKQPENKIIPFDLQQNWLLRAGKHEKIL